MNCPDLVVNGKLPLKNQIEIILNYLKSKDFEQSSEFFYEQKKFFYARLPTIDEAALLKKYFEAQQHILKAFWSFKVILTYKMISVKEVEITNSRFSDYKYRNTISRLVITGVSYFELIHTNKLLENKSVVSYNTFEGDWHKILENSDILNLFPLVIDRNYFDSQSKAIVELYLFVGYFVDTSGNLKYHFISIDNPDLIWQIDDEGNSNSFITVAGTEPYFNLNKSRIKVSKELNTYLTQFKNVFLKN